MAIAFPFGWTRRTADDRILVIRHEGPCVDAAMPNVPHAARDILDRPGSDDLSPPIGLVSDFAVPSRV